MKFIGDLSKQDVAILQEYTSKAKTVLEFGVGGSTQIIAQSCSGYIHSIDTSSEWINTTLENFKRLSITQPVNFELLVDWLIYNDVNTYDVIFNDGIPKHRNMFSLQAWKLLNFGGVMIYHDSRIPSHIDDILCLYQKHWLEIESILVNHNDSNMTIIKKRLPVEYVNWNVAEDKPLWMQGLEKPPRNFLNLLK